MAPGIDARGRNALKESLQRNTVLSSCSVNRNGRGEKSSEGWFIDRNPHKNQNFKEKNMMKRAFDSGDTVLFQSIHLTPTHFEVIYHN